MMRTYMRLRDWLVNQWPWVSKITMRRAVASARDLEWKRVDRDFEMKKAKLDDLFPHLLACSTSRYPHKETVSIQIEIDARLFMSRVPYDRDYLAQLLGHFVKAHTAQLIVLPARQAWRRDQ